MTRAPFHSRLAVAVTLLTSSLLSACAFPEVRVIADPAPLGIVAGDRGTATLSAEFLTCPADQPLTCVDLTGRIIDYAVAQLPDGVTYSLDTSLRSPATPDRVRITFEVAPDVAPDTRFEIPVQAIADGRLVGTSTLTVRVLPGGPRALLPSAVAIAAGSEHSLAALDGGTVAAWGANDDGQLGTGDRRDRETLADVRDIGGIVAVAAGEAHSLALAADGRVWAWGANNAGQLGTGTVGGPGAAVDLAVASQGLDRVIAIAAGTRHSMALRDDGTVWTWGDNDFGRLGLGEFGGRRPLPAQVVGLPLARAIAAGFNYSLAVASDGTVWSWGAYALGAEEHDASDVPIQVAGLADIYAIATAAGAALAIDRQGRLFGWGRNFSGQVGDGTTTDRLVPARVPITGVVVSAAINAVVGTAVTSDGRVWQWGSSAAGAGNLAGLVPHVVTAIPDTVSIATTEHHVLALARCGQVWAWGTNDHGELGTGSRGFGTVIPAEEAVVVERIGDGRGCARLPLRVSVAGAAATANATVTADRALTPTERDLTAIVDRGSTVTLTARPEVVEADGSRVTFDGWTGDCAGTTPQIAVLVDRSVHCVAQYRLVASSQLLTVVSSGGTVRSFLSSVFPFRIDCGDICHAVFAPGERVELRASPLPGFGFTGWTGDCTGTAPTTTVTMDGPKTCHARFRPFELDVVRTGSGRVISEPAGIDCGDACSAAPRTGTVTLTAEPAPGWQFDAWGGHCSGTAPQATVTMDVDRSCTATFSRVPGLFFLTTIVDGQGSVSSQPAGIACPGTCEALFPAGTTVDLTAQPGPTSYISFWLDDCAGIGEPVRRLAIGADTVCRVQFLGQPPVVVAGFTVNGLSTGGSLFLRAGEIVEFNGLESHVFDPVTGTEDRTGIRELAWDFDEDGVFDANGSRASAGIARRVFPAPGDYLVRLRVVGGAFDTADVEERTITVHQAVGPLASLTVAKAGAGAGTIATDPQGIVRCDPACAAQGPIQVETTATITLTAAAAPGSSFAGWNGAGCTSMSATVPVAMTEARTCTATFERNRYTLTIAAPTNGHVGSAPAGIDCGTDCVEEYDGGTSVVLTATPAAGFVVGAWTGCNAVVGGQCTVSMAADRTVGVTFTPATGPFTLTVVVNGPAGFPGRIIGLQPPGAIDCGIGGGVCTLTVPAGELVIVRPDDLTLEQNRMENWTGCNSVGALFACTVRMTADRTITATMRP